jgi:hypothetical protein
MCRTHLLAALNAAQAAHPAAFTVAHGQNETRDWDNLEVIPPGVLNSTSNVLVSLSDSGLTVHLKRLADRKLAATLAATHLGTGRLQVRPQGLWVKYSTRACVVLCPVIQDVALKVAP